MPLMPAPGRRDAAVPAARAEFATCSPPAASTSATLRVPRRRCGGDWRRDAAATPPTAPPSDEPVACRRPTEASRRATSTAAIVALPARADRPRPVERASRRRRRRVAELYWQAGLAARPSAAARRRGRAASVSQLPARPAPRSRRAYAKVQRLEMVVVRHASRSSRRLRSRRPTSSCGPTPASCRRRRSIRSRGDRQGSRARHSARRDAVDQPGAGAAAGPPRRASERPRPGRRRSSCGPTPTAQQDGSLGDLVQVQALEGKERYAARVSGVRELEVFAAGAVGRRTSPRPRNR